MCFAEYKELVWPKQEETGESATRGGNEMGRGPHHARSCKTVGQYLEFLLRITGGLEEHDFVKKENYGVV